MRFGPSFFVTARIPLWCGTKCDYIVHPHCGANVCKDGYPNRGTLPIHVRSGGTSHVWRHPYPRPPPPLVASKSGLNVALLGLMLGKHGQGGFPELRVRTFPPARCSDLERHADFDCAGLRNKSCAASLFLTCLSVFVGSVHFQRLQQTKPIAHMPGLDS